MDIAMIGLGKMGANMATRLMEGGHRVVVYDPNEAAVAAAAEKGAVPAHSLDEVKRNLTAPRSVWVMVPSGDPTESTVTKLGDLLDRGDLVIDGGNSNYKDSMRRAKMLDEKGVLFVDAGTSGGVWGLKEGYSLMVGGSKEAVDRIRTALQTLAPGPDKGWGHVGPAGAGHFVKMVHNGIEYGIMEAYAEGFEVMMKKSEFQIDLAQVGAIWQYGSVVRSWLLDLTVDALRANPKLDGIAPWVSDSGEGRWTVAEAIDLDVPAPVITLALLERLRSRNPESFTDKLLAAMRNEFGGHAMKKEK